MCRLLSLAVRMSQAEPAYVAYPAPPEGAPNVVVIVLDDVGFGQLGCFGAPLDTPHIDRLAAGGLRYNRFHVTSICSSTRASLLTGRNSSRAATATPRPDRVIDAAQRLD